MLVLTSAEHTATDIADLNDVHTRTDCQAAVVTVAVQFGYAMFATGGLAVMMEL